MNTPENLKYAESHEWVRVDGDRAVVGITDHAQDSLGDIVYVELPENGATVAAGDEITTIESVKAAEPIFSPLSGTIVEVNEDLEDSPELINKDPYDAFIFVVEMSDPSEAETLMDASDYVDFVEEEEDQD